MSSTAGLGVILLPGIVTPAEPRLSRPHSLELEVDGVLREADVRGWERFHLVGFSGGVVRLRRGPPGSAREPGADRAGLGGQLGTEPGRAGRPARPRRPR